MKLKRLTDGPQARSVACLFHFTSREIESLRRALRDLADGNRERVNLVEQLGVTLVDDFVLSFVVGRHDLGLVPEGVGFAWVLRPESWDNIEGLVTPFAHDSIGFQWLSDVDDASLLLSSDGHW
jgi:hypothetical protein